MKIAALALLAFVAAPAVAADQFDLNCNGTMHLEGYVGLVGEFTPPKDIPYVVEDQIDLAQGLYCSVGGCREPRKIAALTAATITLLDQPRTDQHPSNTDVVDRTTGHLTGRLGASKFDGGATVDAACVVAPFKPFPVVKQLF